MSPTKRATAATGACSTAGTRTLRAKSRHSEVTFFLQRVEGGLYVERERASSSGAPTVQSVRFADHAQLERWCDEDPERFEHPMLFLELRRVADELWQSAEPA